MRTSPIRVGVCLKRVPIPGAKITVTADGQAVETAHLGFTMSPHEECAVEEAVRLVEAVGGEAVAFTVGPDEAEEQLRYAISLGLSGAVLVPAEGDVAPRPTAGALAEAIRAVEAADGPFDVLLFGNESADAGGYQVGIRVAHALGRPIVNGAKSLEVHDGEVEVVRPAGGSNERYRVPLPAAIGVKEGLNLPRYPTMRGRLASKRAVVGRHDVELGTDGQRMVRLVPTAEQVSETRVLGHGPEAADAVVEVLDELGVLT